MVGIAWVFSLNRRGVAWRLVGIGLGLQVVLALLILKVPPVYRGFEFVGNWFLQIDTYTTEGSKLVFGWLVSPGFIDSYGVVFAFKVLPVIIFFSALSSVLYHLGILQLVVRAFAWVMARTLRISGAESLSAAGNVFLGQTESPLLIKPYLSQLSASELLAVMVGGMATVAGSVMIIYINFLGAGDPFQQSFFATHLLTASVLSAPASLVVAKILLPEAPGRPPDQSLHIEADADAPKNVIEALSKGTSDGLTLALNVAAMLIAFTAFIALLNGILGWVGDWSGLNAAIQAATGGTFEGLSLQYLLGQVFRPIAWLLGIDWAETLRVGSLLGTKTILNEFIAFESFTHLPPGALSPRAKLIAAYALAGFANFASIGIQIGGIGGLVPHRRSEIARLGLRALLGGTLAAFLTAVLAGMLVPEGTP